MKHISKFNEGDWIKLRTLTKEEILKLPENINLYCVGKINGLVVFQENKNLLLTKRTGEYALAYGEIASISVLNTNFAEFSGDDRFLQNDGRLINDSGSDVYELVLYDSE